MMPRTSVSPAAIRKSMTPYCRPFSSCSKTRPQVMAKNKGAVRPYSKVSFFRNLPFHLAVLMVGVLVFLERLLQDLHGDAVLVVGLHRLQEIEVLDRMLVVVELELAAHRVVVRLAHFLDQRLDVLEVALGAAHGGVDQHDRVVALRAIERRRVTELLFEVGDVLLAGRHVEVGTPEARLVLADGGFLERGQGGLVHGEYRVERNLVA